MDDFQPETDGKQTDESTQSSENDGRGQNPASKANLKPFQKGQSGNPGGRQKKNVRFINALKAYGKLDPESTVNNWIDDGRTNSESVIKRVWKDAVSGDKQAIRLMMDYEVFEDGLEEPE